jgi:replicative DNA helicase
MNAPILRQPPHSTVAEQSVIGALLLDARAFDRIGMLRDEHFYRDDHRRIFRHIARLAAAGATVDVVTVSESIERAHESEQTGGLAYLGEIANSTPSAAAIKSYAELIVDRWRERQLMAAGDAIAALALEPGEAKDKVERAQALLSGLEQASPKRYAVTLQAALSRVIDRMQAVADGEAPGLPTGLTGLDHKLGGLRAGTVIVIAARPSMGKTALALGIAEHVAAELGPVQVFSMEMPAEDLAVRSLARASSVSVEKLTRGGMEDDDWSYITAGLGSLHSLPVFIDDNPALTLAEIKGRAREMKRKHGLVLLVVDYLQLAEGHGETRSQQVGEISRGLKGLAKELGIPVIALSQLSRKVDDRPNKRPMLSDLRDSGEIEQDADVVIFIYRDEVYNPDSPDAGIAELLIRKNRQGAIGDVRTAFMGERTLFADLDPHDERFHPAPNKPEAKKRGFR